MNFVQGGPNLFFDPIPEVTAGLPLLPDLALAQSPSKLGFVLVSNGGFDPAQFLGARHLSPPELSPSLETVEMRSVRSSAIIAELSGRCTTLHETSMGSADQEPPSELQVDCEARS